MADLRALIDSVSVLNQVPELGSSLDDSDVPVSGYIYEEINKLSLTSSNDCDQLLHFLLGKLELNQPLKTKLKALKLIKFVVINGNQRFRQNLRKNDWLIKDAAVTSEIFDPVYGNSVSQALRSTAKELLQQLYEKVDDDHVTKSLEPTTPTPLHSSNTGHLGGMGSSNRILGKMKGFGNMPQSTSTNQTTISKVMDGLSDVFDKLLNPPSTSNVLYGNVTDVGEYEAVSLPRISEPLVSRSSSESPSLIVRPKPAFNGKAHIPGRAGGGWDDDDDRQTVGSRKCSSQSVISQNCLDKLVEGDSVLLEAEQQLVDEITGRLNGPSELQPFRSVLELDNLCQRCSSLNCDKVIELLHRRLVNAQEDVVRIRILMMIEMFVNRDVAQVDGLLATFEDSLRQLQNTDSNDLKVKSRKILLILQRLRQSNDGPATVLQTRGSH